MCFSKRLNEGLENKIRNAWNALIQRAAEKVSQALKDLLTWPLFKEVDDFCPSNTKVKLSWWQQRVPALRCVNCPSLDYTFMVNREQNLKGQVNHFIWKYVKVCLTPRFPIVRRGFFSIFCLGLNMVGSVGSSNLGDFYHLRGLRKVVVCIIYVWRCKYASARPSHL